ncbi:hypothetical protein Taro_034446 [Colocasia esculenta]|uniref:Embryo sac development arrest 6 n=1 Tax=Colocasia esculenta TaxID=4460 RepID=A0A843VRD7_COLES|nr:hypothetical protein [Colocasia esculenta]
MASQISNSDRHKLAQLGASKKRKDRDRLDADAALPHSPKAEPAPLPAQAQPAFAGGNRLLAGYLAHEFLTKGTLFGKRWGHPAARPSPPARPHPEAKEPIQQEQQPGKSPMAYAEVAQLLKTEEAHLPGVVNPTQLARWLQL